MAEIVVCGKAAIEFMLFRARMMADLRKILSEGDVLRELIKLYESRAALRRDPE